MRLRGYRGNRHISYIVCLVNVTTSLKCLLEVHLLILVEFLLIWYSTSSPGLLRLIIAHPWIVIGAHSQVLSQILRGHALVRALVSKVDIALI